MKIEDLIHSIGSAIQESHKLIELNCVNHFFENFFDDVKNKNSEKIIYNPKTVEIMLPIQPDKDEAKVLSAPVAALVHHNHMNIDYVKVNLDINVTNEKENKIEVTSQQINNNDTNSEKNNTGSVEILFKRHDSPEGISRIETHLNSIL